MMKSWGVMTKWRLGYWRPWALEISLSLSLSEFYEMLLIPHCFCRTPSLMSAHTHRINHGPPSLCCSEPQPHMQEVREKSLAHSPASNSPQVQGRDAQINSEGPSRNHLGWLGRTAGKQVETWQIQWIRSSPGKQRGECYDNNFFLISLNFPLRQKNISYKDILMNIGS